MITSSESITEIAAAMASAQAEMGIAHKSASNPFLKSTYADLSDVIAALRKPFADNGLSFVQLPSLDGEMVTVTTRLMHKSGEWLEGTCAIPLQKRDAQAVGSCITYARRYSLLAIAGMATGDASEDDDGEAAVSRAPATISAERAAEIAALAQATETDPAKLCAAYKVQSLSELTEANYQNAMKILKKRAAQ